MGLTFFLIYTVLFCSLVTAVQNSDSKPTQYVAVGGVLLEVLVLLIRKDVLDPPGRKEISLAIPALVAGGGLLTFFKMREKSFALLLVFAALLQFFVGVGIVDGL
ncbi:MAG: hypothetical protein U1E76_02235 [Planctomycetota bacterium]